jgi:hypothetical protein
MSTFVLKGQPALKLNDLLRKRKTNLKKFITETGITSYGKLQEKCQKLGVSAPSEEEFKVIVPEPVTLQQEGIVVLDSPPLIKEGTGQKIEIDDFVKITTESEIQPVVHEAFDSEKYFKKKSKNK